MVDTLEELTPDQRIRLLRIAREAVYQFIRRNKVPTIEEADERLHLQQGVFVSLLIAERLRGCIGTFEGEGPLYKTVVDIAIGAATRDPRFAPLRLDEVPRADIELSILSPLKTVQPDDVIVGTHGLLVTLGRRRGTLLPQVPAKYEWSREEFLSQTCLKAGLERDAWQDAERSRLY